MKIPEISPRRIFFSFLFIFLICYSIFQARFKILGPQIEITSPSDGALVSTSVIEITGRAKNIAYISLNDHPIFVDELGNFKEKRVVSKGQSIATIKAKDRYGRETERKIRIVYTYN